MLENVVVVALDGVSPFELSVLCEVFGVDRGERGLPVYDFAVATPDPRRPVSTGMGMTLSVEHGLDRLVHADLVALAPARPWDRRFEPALLDALRAAADRGACVMSVCTGAFGLAQAGLLDGRRATTHWMYADELARRHPAVEVDPDVLYVDEGQVLTSAGTAAGIDLCLHVVRREQGAAVANAIARHMVVPPHRAGRQAQYVETPVAAPRNDDSLTPVLDWARANLDADLSVEALARRAHLSTRTLVRRFRSVTGSTPYAWVLQQRLQLAERLLEERVDLSMEAVAQKSGFGPASVLRHHFIRERGVPPSTYRQTFLAGQGPDARRDRVG